MLTFSSFFVVFWMHAPLPADWMTLCKDAYRENICELGA